VPNTAQTNTDAAALSNTPYIPLDITRANSDTAGDACDADDDNDGMPDTTETAGPPCASASAATDPLVADTDGDRVLDGAECALGSDPANAASKPAAPAPGADTDRDGLPDAYETSIGSNPNAVDSDGDGLQDGWEVKGYNTSPTVIDSDGDGVKDGCEVASLNSDTTVNSGDQGMLSAEIARNVPAASKLANFDLNKDGAINSGDQGFQSSMIRPGKC
jgi:hypothetical protein